MKYIYLLLVYISFTHTADHHQRHSTDEEYPYSAPPSPEENNAPSRPASPDTPSKLPSSKKELPESIKAAAKKCGLIATQANKQDR